MFTMITTWVLLPSLCAVECNVSREDQDAFAIESYKRAQASQGEGKFAPEITPVELKDKKGEVTLVCR